MQDVYDKEVLHRLVGVPLKAAGMQIDPQLSDIVHSNGGGVSAVQSVWERGQRSQETDHGGHSRKRDSSTTREVIDVDADEEEGRYGIARRKRRKTEVIDAETVFTTDSGSGGEVIIIGSSEESDEEGEEEGKKGGQVKINRKRAFWASKAGTAAAGLGT